VRIADFMTRQVITVAPDAPIVEAAKRMLDNKVSGLPVVDAAGQVVGIVSEHDLLRETGKHGPHWLEMMIEGAALADETARFHDRKVSEVMTPHLITIAATSSLQEACRLIEDHGFKRLPVVENGKLIGIIARADLVRAFAQAAEDAGAAKVLDVSVDERQRELERQIWRDRARLSRPF
jgi:CBS domain-containing protein